MKKVVIHSRGLDRIRAGHPWVYKSQIKNLEKDINPGDEVAVYGEPKKFLGVGFINPLSEITIRLISRQEQELDKNFFLKTIQQALKWRKKFLPGETSLRWINSESDHLAGLIVDDYEGHLVLQISSLGMEARKPLLIELLTEIFHPKGIYERNDFPSRTLEGLPMIKNNLYGEPPPGLIEIKENGCRFLIDIIQGHKTGFYLDQRENRIWVGRLAQGKEVLDCFSYTGGFAISSLIHGAKNVLAAEFSEEALSLARKNAEINGVQSQWSDFLGNAFDLLKTLSTQGRLFDLIILDPPSFTRRKASIESALRGYKEINLRAMKMLRDGGILVTASCSHHIQEMLFQQVLVEAASDARKILLEIHRGTQAIDHPIIPAIPETHYLKCFFYEVRSMN